MRFEAASRIRTVNAETAVKRRGRAHSRIACRIACALGDHNVWGPASAVNLSQNGCAVVLANQTLRCGQFVWLRFEQGAQITGIVRWVRGDRAGIEFAHPIRADVVTRLVQTL